MKNYTQNTYVEGTAALQPRRAEGRVATGRLISFPTEQQEPEFYSIDYSKLYRAGHISLLERAQAFCFALLQKSGSLYSLRTGDLKGVSFGNIPRYKYLLAGMLYSGIALLALFIAV